MHLSAEKKEPLFLREGTDAGEQHPWQKCKKSMEVREFFWYRRRNCCRGAFFRGSLSERKSARGAKCGNERGDAAARRIPNRQDAEIGQTHPRKFCGTGRYTGQERKIVCRGAAVLAEFISRPFADEWLWCNR